MISLLFMQGERNLANGVIYVLTDAVANKILTKTWQLSFFAKLAKHIHIAH